MTMLRAALLLVLIGLAGPARAKDLWIEASGQAIQSGPADRDAARRRAVADALLAAALAGGAEVRGHSVLSQTRVTADLLIVRPVGRVLEHRITSEHQSGDLWLVTIRAKVGPRADGPCAQPRRLVVTAYAPQIDVAPDAPAWAVPLADAIAARLFDRLAQQPGVSLRRVTARSMPTTTAQRDSFDYTTLTQGSVRLAPGDHGFDSRIRLTTAPLGPDTALVLDLDMSLLSGQGGGLADRMQAQVRLPGASPLGRLAAVLQPDPDRLAAKLTADVEPTLERLLTRALCAPVAIRLDLRGGVISAPVGRDQGLTMGAIAFTADSDSSVQMLEIVSLGAANVTLRPLDPGVPAAAFAGRPVQFLETGR